MKFSINFKRQLLFLLPTFLYIFLGQGQAQDSLFEQFSRITSFPEFQTGDGILFTAQNPEKIKIIQEMISDHDLKEGIFQDKQTRSTFRFFKTQESFQPPIIEFRRINPTKYRIRIHGASESFPFIFSESFHRNWRLYLVPLTFQQPNLNTQNTQQLLSSHKVFDGNKKTQVGIKQLKNFIKSGWVTDLTRDPPSQTNPYYLIKKLFQGNSSLENPITAFISKKFTNTIQNDNLPTNMFWETWFAGKIGVNCNHRTIDKGGCQWSDPSFWQTMEGPNPNVFEWPDQLHWKANSFLNSWWINLNMVSHLFSNEANVFYRSNPDKTIDLELVMEFWPQRLFYVGGSISLSVLAFCLVALLVRWIRRPNNKGVTQKKYDAT